MGAPQVYQHAQKTCKGPCGRSFPPTPEYFQRCKKYKSDGLDSKCKACAKLHREQRAERSRTIVIDPPRYVVDGVGMIRCAIDGSRAYRDLDGEWLCMATAHYLNPPSHTLQDIRRPT